ncbi:hypothetical protein Baya_8276 [Bagarius yarrelli]|uniref:Uncharacterized protein n=1 Tax=Bagarius yarrelli TaxID=175774 RepID=A0A556U3Q6_BAGYA|nr:hypothetical protein Baya_8276 [Bagarius yarrelli]
MSLQIRRDEVVPCLHLEKDKEQIFPKDNVGVLCFLYWPDFFKGAQQLELIWNPPEMARNKLESSLWARKLISLTQSVYSISSGNTTAFQYVAIMDSVTLYVILFATGCMALDCNWKKEFEYRGRCETCQSGEYPIEHFSENHQSLCKKCTEKSDHCFCNNTLCKDNECSQCSSSPQCQAGEELRRIEINSYDTVIGDKGLVVCFAITVLVCLAMLTYLCIKKTKKLKMKKKHPLSSSFQKVGIDEFAGCKLSKEEMGEV